VLELYKKIWNDLKEEENFVVFLQKTTADHFQKLFDFAEGQKYHHYLQNIFEGGFLINAFNMFQKPNFHSFSIATDGVYIYLHIGTSNGGMYKIGTGGGHTIAGKIYIFIPTGKCDEAA